MDRSPCTDRYSSIMSTASNTATASNQHEIEDFKNSEWAIVETDNEQKENNLSRWLLFWYIFLPCILSVGYMLPWILYLITSMNLQSWKNENLNHTNFEEIRAEHLRMHITMNALLLLILLENFYLELSIWGPRYYIQRWRTNEYKETGFFLLTSLYFISTIICYVVPSIWSPQRKREYLRNVDTLTELKQSYFCFQLAAILSLIGMIVCQTIHRCRAENPETRSDPSASTLMIDEETIVCPPTHKLMANQSKANHQTF